MRRWAFFGIWIGVFGCLLYLRDTEYWPISVVALVLAIPVAALSRRRNGKLDRVVGPSLGPEPGERTGAIPYKDQDELMKDLRDPMKAFIEIFDRLHVSDKPLRKCPVDVRDFGASACGDRDDTVALQQAIAFALEADRTVSLPSSDGPKHKEGDVVRFMQRRLVLVLGSIDDGTYWIRGDDFELIAQESELSVAIPRKGEHWEKLPCAQPSGMTTLHGSLTGRTQWAFDCSLDNPWVLGASKCCYKPVNLGRG